jgi:hypothetical protein
MGCAAVYSDALNRTARITTLKKEPAMVLGMSLAAFTTLHTAIALVGIFSGVVAVTRMLRVRRLNGWTTLFLFSTALTTITGFFFPFREILPSHIVGVISLVALVFVFVALYVKELEGGWRVTYIAGAVFVLYLNTFVGVVQSFQKVSFLRPLAPTQAEPPFIIVQGLLLLVSVIAFFAVSRRFRPGAIYL